MGVRGIAGPLSADTTDSFSSVVIEGLLIFIGLCLLGPSSDGYVFVGESSGDGCVTIERLVSCSIAECDL